MWTERTKPSSTWEKPDGSRLEIGQEDTFSILQEDSSLIYAELNSTWTNRNEITTNWS